MYGWKLESTKKPCRKFKIQLIDGCIGAELSYRAWAMRNCCLVPHSAEKADTTLTVTVPHVGNTTSELMYTEGVFSLLVNLSALRGPCGGVCKLAGQQMRFWVATYSTLARHYRNPRQFEDAESCRFGEHQADSFDAPPFSPARPTDCSNDGDVQLGIWVGMRERGQSQPGQAILTLCEKVL